MPSSAARFETLQCERPVSTQDGICHIDEDLRGQREADFQLKGYTFSQPFHLIVSYGEVLGRTDQCRPALSPISQTSPFSPIAHLGRCPQEAGHSMRYLLPHIQPTEARVPSVPGPREVVPHSQQGVRVTWTHRESLGVCAKGSTGGTPKEGNGSHSALSLGHRLAHPPKSSQAHI